MAELLIRIGDRLAQSAIEDSCPWAVLRLRRRDRDDLRRIEVLSEGDSDGVQWLRTGDLGMLPEEITDRERPLPGVRDVARDRGGVANAVGVETVALPADAEVVVLPI